MNIVSRKIQWAVIVLLVGVSFWTQAQPVIVTQPISVLTQALGLSTTLSVTAQGNAPLNYQWRLNGVNIPGATNNTYVIGGLLTTDCGNYTVTVSDPYFAVDSIVARITASLLAISGNDNFTNRAGLLGLGSGNVRSSNVNATRESREPSHAGNKGGKSIWFKWTPLTSGVVTFTTAGSGFDTILAAYTGTALNNLKVVPSSVSDDDRGGYLTSKVSFNATAFKEYEIAVDGYNGASGDVVLSWSEDLTLDLLPKIEDHPDASDVVAKGGSVNLSLTCDPSTVTWLFNGQPTSVHGTNFFIGQVDDSTVGNYVAQAVSSGGHKTFSLPARVQINIHEDGSTDTNALALDKFQDSIVAAPVLDQRWKKGYSAKGGGDSRGYSLSQVFSTTGATKEPGEPNHCGQVGGCSAWFSYTPPTNGMLHVHTEGSTFNTILAVYIGPGDSFATLTNVGCGYTTNRAVNGQPHVFVPNVNSNTTYYIVVDGYNASSGTAHLTINDGAPVSIVAAPQSEAVPPGSTATFNVTTTGSGPVNLQWQFNGAMIPNATNATLTVTNVQSAKTGTYTVLVSNNVSTITANASLALVPPVMPHFDTVGVKNGAIQFNMIAQSGSTCILQTTTNLATVPWASIATNVAGSGPINFSTPVNRNEISRFYRMIVQ